MRRALISILVIIVMIVIGAAAFLVLARQPEIAASDPPAKSAFDAGAEPRERPAVSVQYSADAGRLEAAVPAPRRLSARRVEERGIEPGRLSGRRIGALRRLPYAAQQARGREAARLYGGRQFRRL